MDSIIKIHMASRTELAKNYIQQFKAGGMFVAGKFDYKLGDGIFMVISLPESNETIAVNGKVCWISPSAAVGYHQGIGIQFNNDKAGAEAKSRLEIMLGGAIQHQGVSYTF